MMGRKIWASQTAEKPAYLKQKFSWRERDSNQADSLERVRMRCQEIQRKNSLRVERGKREGGTLGQYQSQLQMIGNIF